MNIIDPKKAMVCRYCGHTDYVNLFTFKFGLTKGLYDEDTEFQCNPICKEGKKELKK
jgi:hypothetical protein